jgi:hypothetical protein
VAWQLTKRLSLTATINNLTAEPHRESAYGSATQIYARQALISDFGSAMGVGIRGTF